MMKTGLTPRTLENIQLNAGVMLWRYKKGEPIKQEDIIGATRGGGSFSITPTVRQIAVDGAPAYTIGLERIDDHVVSLQVTMIEISPESIAFAMGSGTKIEKVGADKKLTVTRNIQLSDYKEVHWVGDTTSGKNIHIKLSNAMSLSGVSLTITDKGEGTYPINVTAHYSINDMDTAPFEWTWEDVDSASYTITEYAAEEKKITVSESIDSEKATQYTDSNCIIKSATESSQCTIKSVTAGEAGKAYFILDKEPSFTPKSGDFILI